MSSAFESCLNYGAPLDIPVITIDGPTASGKGTVAQRLAKILGFHFLDSGALYRLVALEALQKGIALDDEPALAALASKLPCRFSNGRILLGDQDATDAIRTEDVGIASSRVAALPAVRAALVERQLRFQQPPGLVADGRDMGTVIFPEAPVKIYLTASVAARAERRYKQLMEKGISANIDVLRQDLADRDARDEQRATAPLKPAEDAFLLDTSNITADEAVAIVLQQYRAYQKEPT